MQPDPTTVAELAPTGTLRVAVNTGNIVLVQVAADGSLSGIVATLAAELARRLGVPLALLPYKRPGEVAAAAADNAWDVCFLAVEPARAVAIAFTEPYLLIDGTYLVTADSPLAKVAELDRVGCRIGVGKGTAYDLYLTRTLQAATLVRTETGSGSGPMLLRGEVDAVAGVRQALDRMARELGGVRVMPDRFMAIGQAAGVPHGRPAAHVFVEAFIREAKATGLVRQALVDSGQDPGAAA